MTWIKTGVTAARGFQASGVSCGIKRSRKPDLALVASDVPAAAAGTLTTNRVQAAPVLVSAARLKTGVAKAVLLNSGCANCLTGKPGLRDARALCRRLSQVASIPEAEILVASTGIIGRRLPVPRIVRAMPQLVKQLSPTGHREAAQAIMTTDTVRKEAAVEASIGGRRVAVGGMAKGAGMIMPGMATMLCVITTDASIERGVLDRMVRQAVEQTFNRISIDGDMSTNDTVFVLANGVSGVRVRAGSAQERAVSAMLREVMQRLALLIVKDGEGATRVARIEVVGARSEAEALACARQVANSALVQTMLAAADPNVGRIAAAAGASSAWFDQSRLEVRIDGRLVVSRGAVHPLGEAVAKKLLAPKEVTIQLHLHAGRGAAHMLTCDLTEDYVRLNARYTT